MGVSVSCDELVRPEALRGEDLVSVILGVNNR
jgi:hypothetical protein